MTAISSDRSFPSTPGYGESATLVYLCGVCAAIGYCDRVNLSVAVLPISSELGWTVSERGYVLGAFFNGYVCSQIFGAQLARAYGWKRVLGVAVLLWSIVTALTPAVAKSGSLAALCGWRLLLGIFEGVTYPVMYDAFSDLVPEASRSSAIALVNVGNGVGSCTAFALTPWLTDRYGWPSTFHFFGGLGMCWVVAWWRLLPDDRPTALTKMPAAAASGTEVFRILRQVLAAPPALAITVMHFCNNFGGWMMLAWLPSILADQFALPGGSLWLACLPYVFYMLGAGFGGVGADTLISRGHSRLAVRRRFATVGYSLGAAALVAFTATSSGYVAVGCFCAERLLIVASAVGSYEPNKLELTSPATAGTFQAFVNSVAALAGVVAVPAAGAMLQLTESWTSMLLLVAVMYSLAAYLYWRNASCDRCIE